MDYQQIIEDIMLRVKPSLKDGKQADYIPALAKVNADQIGICLTTLEGERFASGSADERFSIQSISKVFTLAMCLSAKGDLVWERMGKEPSGTAFNSLIQLEIEKGKPRNPFINSGAIVMCDMLISYFKARGEDYKTGYLSFIRSICGCNTIAYNTEIANSERSCGYLNAAIANMLKYYGNIHNQIEEVLMFYFLTCSIEMSCCELSQAFLPFANHKKVFNYGGVCLTTSQIKRMNALMQTCGFYDESGDFSYLVGLPGKSGVGGGIAAIYPLRYSVAVWSPRLNDKGNSIVGLKALELLTTHTQESIF